MANRKNNISDKEVENAAGGRIEEMEGRGYSVYDDDDNHLIAAFYGPRSMEEKRHDAEMYEDAYRRGKMAGEITAFHKGKEEGYGAGYSAGFNKGLTLKNIDNNGCQ